MECEVCLDYYDTGVRKPKSLSCGHTFCCQCLENLLAYNSVRCPSCRGHTYIRQGRASELPTNYASLAFLRTLCQECQRHTQQKQCNHCEKSLCGKCLRAHCAEPEPTENDDIFQVLNSLKQHIQRLEILHNDITEIHIIQQNGENMICQALGQFKEYSKQIKDYRNYLIAQIRNLNTKDVQKFHDWRNKLGIELSTAKQCLDESYTKARLGQMSQLPEEDRIEINDECRQIEITLNAFDNSVPVKTEYSYININSNDEFGSFLTTLGQLSFNNTVCEQIPEVQTDPETRHTSDISCCNLGQKKGVLDRPWFTWLVIGILTGVIAAYGINTFNLFRPVTSNPLALVDNFAPDYASVSFDKTYGKRGVTAGEFAGPLGLTISPVTGNIIVADSDNNRLQILKPAMGWMIMDGGNQGVSFQSPIGLAVNSKGLLYITEEISHYIQVINEDGNFVLKFGKHGYLPGEYEYPRGIAFSNDDILYICDSGNYRVQLVHPNGTFVHIIGERGSRLFKSRPHAIAINGNLVVVSDWESTIYIFSLNGHLLQIIKAGQQPYNIEINGIGLDPIGNMILTDDAGRLVIMDQSERVVNVMGTQGDKLGQLRNPHGVLVLGGRILVCDTKNHRVQALTVSNQMVV